VLHVEAHAVTRFVAGIAGNAAASGFAARLAVGRGRAGIVTGAAVADVPTRVHAALPARRKRSRAARLALALGAHLVACASPVAAAAVLRIILRVHAGVAAPSVARIALHLALAPHALWAALGRVVAGFGAVAAVIGVRS
jgi:hypothetical protein